MALCKVCGNELGSGDLFCPRCGAPAGYEQTRATGGADDEGAPQIPDAGTAPDRAAGPADAMRGVPASPVDGASEPADGARGVAQPPVLHAQPQLSPLKRSWMDFKASPGKFKILLKLTGFQFVPGVGGLVLSGYSFTWAKEQALGRHMPMPGKIVRPGVLDNGLYIYGVSLIAGIASLAAWVFFGTVLSALGLGALLVPLALVFLVCSAPFFQVMYMRTALCGRVRSGANLKRVWDLFSAPGKMGKTFTSYWVPALLSGFVCVAIGILLGVVATGVAVTSAPFHGYMHYLNDAAYVAWWIISLLLSFFPVLTIGLFALNFVSAAAQIIVARAFGYWMQDFHPEEWQEYQEHSKYYMDRAL